MFHLNWCEKTWEVSKCKNGVLTFILERQSLDDAWGGFTGSWAPLTEPGVLSPCCSLRSNCAFGLCWSSLFTFLLSNKHPMCFVSSICWACGIWQCLRLYHCWGAELDGERGRANRGVGQGHGCELCGSRYPAVPATVILQAKVPTPAPRHNSRQHSGYP